jgi:hypothetical protein
MLGGRLKPATDEQTSIQRALDATAPLSTMS